MFFRHSQKSSSKENDKLVYDFFLELSTDAVGRRLSDILNFSEREIEEKHDFIQWIFPTKEASQFNYNAPVISGNFKYMFSENKIVQDNFCKSCMMFLNFIAIDCDKEKEIITEIKEKKKYYDLPRHNLLRITRMLNSLNQIGKNECSKRIFKQLEKIYNDNPKSVPKLSFSIWKKTQI